ncbi:hypothetical protein [Halorussus sp. AFM4]|uniref:hypothetical protein n=1 Tax=Halorussus sp. AFM4 TaxID=3421651 RepID=UPI003EBFC568
MADFQELDQIVLALLQVTGLLLPVVFLTFKFYLRGAENSIPERKLHRRLRLVVAMIIALTVTGFCASVGLLDMSLKPHLTLIAVISLASFFILYGVFIYRIIKWEQLKAA